MAPALGVMSPLPVALPCPWATSCLPPLLQGALDLLDLVRPAAAQGRLPGVPPRVAPLPGAHVEGRRHCHRPLLVRSSPLTVPGCTIPACAGETPRTRQPASHSWAYPRVRGGNSSRCSGLACHTGLSPRARGKRPRDEQQLLAYRPIPACAGETSPHTPAPPGRRAYPRVRGGNFEVQESDDNSTGLSPRARGKRRGRRSMPQSLGPIPACAGETRRSGETGPGRRAYPRVRGGNASPKTGGPLSVGLSPRARGKRGRSAHLPVPPGPIPACAGET